MIPEIDHEKHLLCHQHWNAYLFPQWRQLSVKSNDVSPKKSTRQKILKHETQFLECWNPVPRNVESIDMQQLWQIFMCCISSTVKYSIYYYFIIWLLWSMYVARWFFRGILIYWHTSRVPRLCPGWGITKTFTTLFAHDFNLGLGST